MDIHSLGYVGVEGPNLEDWRDFATGICGLTPSSVAPGAGEGESGPGGDVLRFKMDDRRWRLAIHRAEMPGLRYAGYEVASRSAFETAVGELREHGISVTEGKPEECAERGVRAMAHFEDPAANRIELFFTAESDTPIRPPLGGSRFVTGPLGMGHLAMLVSDLDACLAFYLDVLGFEESDYFEIGPGMAMHFIRCNPRHHSLAIGRVGDFKALHHLLFEVENIDQVGSALDRAKSAAVPISTELGRHANDMMLSFYMKSPFGFDIEIGCDGRLVEPGWVSGKLVQADLWGHAGLSADTGGGD